MSGLERTGVSGLLGGEAAWQPLGARAWQDPAVYGFQASESGEVGTEMCPFPTKSLPYVVGEQIVGPCIQAICQAARRVFEALSWAGSWIPNFPMAKASDAYLEALPSPFDLARLNGTNGVRIEGAYALDTTGVALAVGDVNGDRLLDLIIGAPGPSPLASGKVFVIYGRKGGLPSPLALRDLDEKRGTVINGQRPGDGVGNVVASLDFDGDGIDDVAVGAPQAPYNLIDQTSGPGYVYVVYGRREGLPFPVDLAALNGTTGVVIRGVHSGKFFDGSYGDRTGSALASADMNQDGIGDLVISAPVAPPPYNNSTGTVYVVYGKKGGLPSPFDLASLNTTTGLILFGSHEGSMNTGCALAVCDANGDHLDDLVIGANAAPVTGGVFGKVYVLYGKKGGGISGSTTIDGALLNGNTGSKVSCGDINGDRIDDVLCNAPGPGPTPVAWPPSYVVYGKKGGIPSVSVSALNGTNGFLASAPPMRDFPVGVGDLNGDGFQDLVVGAPGTPYPSGQGQVYVLYGRAEFPSAIGLNVVLNANYGVLMRGIRSQDMTGFTVLGADINRDGIGDLVVSAPNAPADPLDVGPGVVYIVYGAK